MPVQSCDLIRASDWRALYVNCTGDTGPIHVWPDGTPSLRMRETGLGMRQVEPRVYNKHYS